MTTTRQPADDTPSDLLWALTRERYGAPPVRGKNTIDCRQDVAPDAIGTAGLHNLRALAAAIADVVPDELRTQPRPRPRAVA